MKGVVCEPTPNLDDLKALKEAGAAVIRYQLYVPASVSNWENNILAQLEYLDTLQLPLPIVLDLHSAPPIEDNGVARIAAMWKKIAKRYKDNSKVICYGILNEPPIKGRAINAFMQLCWSTIRAIDRYKFISFCCGYGDANRFKSLEYVNDKNLWYEFHMYYPTKFTHQGVYGRPVGIKYPGDGINKYALKEYVSKVRDFQLANNAQIFVGEIGCSVFGDEISRSKYFRDCLMLFNEYGWFWCAHAWRESPIWDLETRRVFRVLKKGFA